MNFDLIIYHGNCPDGFTAAWAFWHKFGSRAEYIPCGYGQEAPDVTGKTVAIVDFSFPRQQLIDMTLAAKYLVVLDHHRSAERDLEGLTFPNGEIIFDMERSGAQIAWDYLNEKDRPWFVDYVADRDLWHHSLPNTREISEALFFDGYFQDFDKLDKIYVSKVGNLLKEFAKKGTLLLEQKTRACEYYANNAVPTIMKIGNHSYRVHLAGCPRMYRSDVGNLICEKKCDFAAVYWYDFYRDQWYISLRAGKDSTVDLSEITSYLPCGGGHAKAAGFTIYGPENLNTYFTRINF